MNNLHGKCKCGCSAKDHYFCDNSTHTCADKHPDISKMALIHLKLSTLLQTLSWFPSQADAIREVLEIAER